LKKTLVKDSIYYTIPSVFSAGISFFLLPIYTRFLSPTDYGSLDLVIVIAILINKLVPLEITQGLARYYPNENKNEKRILLSSTAFWFTFCTLLIFVIVCLYFEKNLNKLLIGQELVTEYRIAITYILSNGLLYVTLNQFRWELRATTFALGNLIFIITTASISLVLTCIYSLELKGMLLGLVSGSVIALVFNIYNLRNSILLKFNFGVLKNMLVFSAPLVLSSLSVWVSSYIDRIMINDILSLHQVGLYAVAFKLSSIVALILIGIQGAITPLIYKHHGNPETPKQISHVYNYFVFFSLIIYLILTLYTSELFSIISDSVYEKGSTVVVFLVPSILLSQMYVFCPGLSIAKKTFIILLINFCGCIVNVILNYFLIREFSIVGAGISTLIGSLVVFITFYLFSQKYYYIKFNWDKIIFVWLLCILMILLSILYKPDSYFLTHLSRILAFPIFIGACLYSKLININDLRSLKNHFTNK
jgi:O-antigen/teichoic acid export membrane protein